jgi:hypothetical protein
MDIGNTGGDTRSSGGGEETFSWLALQRFLEISLPLMFLTFAVTFFWFWHERRNSKKKVARLQEEYPDVFHEPKSSSSRSSWTSCGLTTLLKQ